MSDLTDSPVSVDSSEEVADEVRVAKWGLLWIAGAKAYFMVAGAAIELLLARFVAPSVFGAWKLVGGTVSPINNVLVTGTVQAVSRFTAQDPRRAGQVQASAFRMHWKLGLPVAILFVLSAPLIAKWFKDDSKIPAIALAGAIVALYSFYAVYVGRANGEKNFHKQAGLDVTFASLRAALVLGMAALGFGLLGAIGGWVVAACLILVVARAVVGAPPKSTPSADVQKIRKYMLGVSAFLILLNAIMVVDIWVLKRAITGYFAANPLLVPLGQDGHALSVASAADRQVGFYGAAQTLARLSYQAIIAATFVIFPLVSRTTFAKEESATRQYIETTTKYSYLLACAVACVFVSNPSGVLSIAFSEVYVANAALPLAPLAIGHVAFCLFAIAGTILNGAGRTKDAIVSAGVTFVCAAALLFFFVLQEAVHDKTLLVAAICTCISMSVGALWALVRMRIVLGASLPIPSFIRITAAFVAVGWMGRYFAPTGKIPAIGFAMLSGIVFIALLGLLREVTLAQVAGILGRKNRG